MNVCPADLDKHFLKEKKIFKSITCIKKILPVVFILKPVEKKYFFFQILVQFPNINIYVYNYMACTVAFFNFQMRSQNFKQGNSPLWLYLRVDHHHIVFRYAMCWTIWCTWMNRYLRQDNWNVIGGSELGAWQIKQRTVTVPRNQLRWLLCLSEGFPHIRHNTDVTRNFMKIFFTIETILLHFLKQRPYKF